jgi:hypothetical protein
MHRKGRDFTIPPECSHRRVKRKARERRIHKSQIACMCRMLCLENGAQRAIAIGRDQLCLR